MDTQQLRMFVTLADQLHFNKAAELCHTSASTLSRNIKQIEEELNTVLFERDNRSVRMTPQGARMLMFARETLQHWDTLQESLQASANKLQGSISLYCSVTASYSFLYEILADFRRQHPLIEIKLHTGDPALAVDRVSAGYEDIAIAARLDSMPQTVSFKRISYSPLVLIQPQENPWHTKDTQSFWQQVPFILSEKGVARERMEEWFKHQQITPNIYAQVAGHEAIVSMVSLGFGIGLIPQIVLDNSPLKDKVRSLPMEPELKPYEVGLCVAQKRLKSPIVRAFWEQF